MKLKHLFFAAAAAVLAFAACKQEEPIGVPDLQVTPSSVSFQAGASSQTVTLTATRDWTVSGAPEWLAFDPSSGKASDGSQTVTITAMANSGYNRSADVTFTIGLMKAYVHVDQTGEKGEFDSGDGSKERPFSATAAYEYTLSLPSDGEGGPFYIKGIVSSVGTTFEASGNYGNASFYLSDDGSTTGTQFYVYQTYYLGNRKWKSGDKEVKAGDEVIVYGKVVNYKGNTPETVGKGSSYVYSLNGETGDTTPQTEIAASTVADFISKADGSTYYRLTGKVSAFKTGTNSSGKNWMQFNLTDETGTILVYGFKDGEYDKWAGTIKDGGTATLTGTYEYYEQKKQHEVMNTTIESFEAGETPGPGDVTATTVSDFIAKADGNTYYRLTGTVSEFKTGTNSSGKNWMQFNLTDNSGTILVYGFNDGEYDKWAGTIKNGGTVTLNGTYEYYEQKKQHEVMNTTIESFEAGETPPGPSGEVKAVTIAEFLAASESSTQWYELTGKVSNIRSGNGEKYGNFDLTDATGTIYVYGLTSKKVDKNDQSFASLGIKEGDEITIISLRSSYQGEPQAGGTPPAYLKAGGTPGGQGGGGGEETGDFASNVSWTSGSDSAAYDEKANVNGTANVAVLKLGTGSKTGSSTLTLPEGSTSLTFYAFSWKDKPSKAVFKVNGTEVASIEPAANSGLSNKEPYTLTVTASDKYTITFSATSTLTVETSGTNTRVALFGVQAK